MRSTACAACPEGRFPNSNATVCVALVDSPAPTPLAAPVKSMQQHELSGWAVAPSGDPHRGVGAGAGGRSFALKGWSVHVVLLAFGSTAMLWAACAGMCVLRGELTKHKRAVEMQGGAFRGQREGYGTGQAATDQDRREEPGRGGPGQPGEQQQQQRLLTSKSKIAKSLAVVRVMREPQKRTGGDRGKTAGLVAAWSPAPDLQMGSC
jgi:hypothetical protein